MINNSFIIIYNLFTKIYNLLTIVKYEEKLKKKYIDK